MSLIHILEAIAPSHMKAHRIAAAKEAVCEAAKELEVVRKASINKPFLGYKMEVVQAELALELAVDALIQAEASGES